MTTKRNVVLKVQCFSWIGPARRGNEDNVYCCGRWNSRSKSKWMEETVVTLNPPQVLAVFDGMGGEEDGELASLVAAEQTELLEKRLHAGMSAQEIRDALDAFNMRFLQALEMRRKDSTSICGTTGVGIILDGGIMIPFWMGDSRLYLLRDGSLHCLTKDHSVGQELIDQGKMTEAEARRTSQWHRLRKYMGQMDESFSIADSMVLRDGDRLLLCSDGITDVCRDDALEEILCGSAQTALARLWQIACEEAHDNSTVILADVTMPCASD